MQLDGVEEQGSGELGQERKQGEEVGRDDGRAHRGSTEAEDLSSLLEAAAHAERMGRAARDAALLAAHRKRVAEARARFERGSQKERASPGKDKATGGKAVARARRRSPKSSDASQAVVLAIAEEVSAQPEAIGSSGGGGATQQASSSAEEASSGREVVLDPSSEGDLS